MAYFELIFEFESLFFVTKWADDSDLFKIVNLFVMLFWMIVYTFLLCEPAARMTNQFSLFDDEVSKCDWYWLSIEMQRMYMVFLSNTQHPMKMQSFANIIAERETTKKVLIIDTMDEFKRFHFDCQFQIINNAFSYFMTIRQFEI